MGQLKYLVIHCTATPPDMDVTAEMIRDWHLNGRGWSRVGYSDLIKLDGSLVNLTQFDQDNEVDYNEMTWGVKGINGVARHVVYAGGTNRYGHPLDTRTVPQFKTLETYLQYTAVRHPNIKIAGHNQFANKACPSFDVPSYLNNIGLKEFSL